jgi:hypothetical protein
MMPSSWSRKGFSCHDNAFAVDFQEPKEFRRERQSVVLSPTRIFGLFLPPWFCTSAAGLTALPDAQFYRPIFTLIIRAAFFESTDFKFQIIGIVLGSPEACFLYYRE